MQGDGDERQIDRIEELSQVLQGLGERGRTGAKGHAADTPSAKSWTGILIYEVEAAWPEDRLYLGQVRVNRDPEQYGEIDDDYDRRLLIERIVVGLLGEHAPFPVKDTATPQEAAVAGRQSGI